MRRVALDGLHEVGDEVVPPLELHVDLRPGGVDLVTEPDQPVVLHHNQDQHEDQDEADTATEEQQWQGTEAAIHGHTVRDRRTLLVPSGARPLWIFICCRCGSKCLP